MVQELMVTRTIARIHHEDSDDTSDVYILEFDRSLVNHESILDFYVNKRRRMARITRLTHDVVIKTNVTKTIRAIPEGDHCFFFRITIERGVHPFVGPDLVGVKVKVFVNVPKEIEIHVG